MAVVDADYSTAIETLRGHLAAGTRSNDVEMKQLIALLQNGISKASTVATPSSDLTTAYATLATNYATQIAILVAKGAADASAEIATAKGVLDADVASCTTKKTALIAATPTVPTYITSVGMDG